MPSLPLPVVGLEFHTDVVGPAVVLGIMAAGLYGMLSVSLVLTYRVSRTIGFVNGGVALFGTFIYWWLTGARAAVGPSGEFAIPARMGKVPGAFAVTLMGAVIGVVYGFTVTGRLSNWPRVRITTYSLGWLLAFGAVVFGVFQEQVQGTAALPLLSMFGRGRVSLFGANVAAHQVATLVILLVLCGVLSLLLLRTRVGVFIRAIADDPEAGRWVGIPLHWVGTGVYAFSGGLSAFAGVLMASTVGINILLVLVLFLRALTMSVLGGFTSLPLALTGCLVLGVGETALNAGVLGTMSSGEREVIIMTVLFGLVFLINRLRRVKLIEVAGL